jgi:hypothetical protein
MISDGSNSLSFLMLGFKEENTGKMIVRVLLTINFIFQLKLRPGIIDKRVKDKSGTLINYFQPDLSNSKNHLFQPRKWIRGRSSNHISALPNLSSKKYWCLQRAKLCMRLLFQEACS